MTRFDGPQKANGFGFQPADGFKFKSAEQLSGSDKEIVLPLSSNASEAEKAKLKQQKEDAKVQEQYEIDKLKEKARKLGYDDATIENIVSSKCKVTSNGIIIDAGTKYYTSATNEKIKTETQRIYPKNRSEGTLVVYKKTYYKMDKEGKYNKVAITNLEWNNLDKKSDHNIYTDIYRGNNVKRYGGINLDESFLETSADANNLGKSVM